MWPREASAALSRVVIGGPDCKQPYNASLLNVSAMSYGALSENAILALSRAAKKGGFYVNTGEVNSISSSSGRVAEVVAR